MSASEYGPGVGIVLTGEEVALAIEAYLFAHSIRISGPRTIKVNGKLCEKGFIYTDPSGSVIYKGKIYSGRGAEAIDVI